PGEDVPRFRALWRRRRSAVARGTVDALRGRGPCSAVRPLGAGLRRGGSTQGEGRDDEGGGAQSRVQSCAAGERLHTALPTLRSRRGVERTLLRVSTTYHALGTEFSDPADSVVRDGSTPLPPRPA